MACVSPTCGSGLYQADGTCVVVPTDCNDSCGTHEICELIEQSLACVCAPGYEGDPCQWVGVVLDPGFAGPVADEPCVWIDERSTGAECLPKEPASTDPGAGLLRAGVVCSGGGFIQQIQMPSLEVAEPLLAEVTYRTKDDHKLGVGFGQAWMELPQTANEWRTDTLCLGVGAYGEGPNGGAVDLRLSASEESDDCFEGQNGAIWVDRFEIKPALGSCPSEPGEVLNSHADEIDGGWEFYASEGASAGFAANQGQSGSAVEISRVSNGLAAMTTRLSVGFPSDDKWPALRFWWRGSSGGLFGVDMGTFAELGNPGRSVDRLSGVNAGRTHTYCLPPWTHGNVVELAFSLLSDGEDVAQLFVDDVELIMTSECKGQGSLLDPGFESTLPRWTGTDLKGTVDQLILVQDEMETANNGNGSLELRYWTSEADLAMEQFVLVPETSDAECPLLVFFSDVPAQPEATVRWVLGGAGQESKTLDPGGSWQENQVPLPRSWAGRWYRFRLQVGPPESPGTAIATKRIFIDDFGLTTTSDCPANP